MPSEKLRRILIAKSRLSPEDISAMSEADGWAWVYANAQPRKPKDVRPQICFTGFTADDRAMLSELAARAHLHVVSSVTKELMFLCAGANAGPAKVESARSKGNQIISKEQFLELLETGELPVVIRGEDAA